MAIPVTKTFFPPLEEYHKQLEQIWEHRWLTNRGQLVVELEEKLKELLHVPDVILTTNGTLPIQISLKCLAKGGEVITTPFSYIATTSAILWENLDPVFVDIHPEYFSIDENQIEAAITPKTKAILATHVFGNPCNVEVIQRIAENHNLKVIYDAAHAFGVNYKGQSLFNFGDVSTCSFHATKIFHTGEGGALFSSNEELMHELYYSHNFGHKGPTEFHGLGINAKMSELQAAMGLTVLPYMKEIQKKREQVVQFYDENINFDGIHKMKIRKNTDWNFSYYPIVFHNEKSLLKSLELLRAREIIPRRYFYPSLNTLKFTGTRKKMPNSERIAANILCLPLYHDVPKSGLHQIVAVLNKS